jgi:DNA helicase-2/ATP-dependent DNA helicase PcrA
VDKFCELHDHQQLPWSDMAVFYRVNSLSRAIEDELRNRGIPYQIARGTAFYERKEIKDAVAYLRTISNPDDEVNLLRIINTPARGISTASVKTMQAYAAANNMNVAQVILKPQQISALNSRAVASVNRFGAQLTHWRDQTEAVDLTLRSFLETVLRESGLESFYAANDGDPDEDRAMNLGELVSSAQQFEDELEFADMSQDQATLARRLQAFLERISLVSDVDSVDADQGSVTLMTLHAAKGLEFPVVAMMGVEEGLLPHDRAVAEQDEVEEERRLCFVGITRAMRQLFLTFTRRRTVFGQTLPATPSRFLRELPKECLALDELDDLETDAFTGEARFGAAARQRQRAAEEAQQYPPGTRVRHPQFGLGRVLSISPAGAHTRARIEFATVGVKTLVLQYARLDAIG